jgi:hypothetical protein
MKPNTGTNSRSQFAGHSYDAFEVLKRIILTVKDGKYVPAE